MRAILYNDSDGQLMTGNEELAVDKRKGKITEETNMIKLGPKHHFPV